MQICNWDAMWNIILTLMVRNCQWMLLLGLNLEVLCLKCIVSKCLWFDTIIIPKQKTGSFDKSCINTLFHIPSSQNLYQFLIYICSTYFFWYPQVLNWFFFFSVEPGEVRYELAMKSSICKVTVYVWMILCEKKSKYLDLIILINYSIWM